MGKFIYGTPSISVEFDDRVLAHLKVVILSKVRRGESFTFSWDYTVASGSGHSSIWIHPTIPLQFDFVGSREPQLNRAWVEELVKLANSPAGLRVIPEPNEPATANR
ncbi:ATP-dependent DNA ligase [Mycetocola zhujimingii]|uniref:ATP-dependent DNA ligase n=1 Tax=Mycetocola zhujimingii TaxID=2079792 RepID=A0A2U1TC93_9MICO|nr:ATP-dependent DNA ligase [Mycetocola zhujimingii]AWB87621.1 ATP-dependent DNA ligase [Mycetocola zhujimingii]PWC06403.1 ATP-dependent DNA ligase [Mycetocola zhujimingii]